MQPPVADVRQIQTGRAIPKEHYCDQPYVVVCRDGAWLCVMTTGRGVEGEPGQHVISSRSTDQGRTWSQPLDIEPADGPEASWVMPLITPSGRVYAFYVYNFENRREVISDQGPIKRVDSFGALMFRYSDDHGLSWSPQRYRVPIREFECDRRNAYAGRVQFFWGVGKPITDRGVAYLGLSKVHGFGHGFFTGTEGIFMRSDNLLTEPDADQLHWATLPDGEVGLKSPVGPIAEEHNLVALGDGSLYCTYRTIAGSPCHAYSRDGGHTWTAPEFMSYTPGGRQVKNPRAANFVKKAANGHFLYWFHNHGGKWYDDRNPAWILGGVERDGHIYWSQPEVLLYDDDPRVRMSYPDFIEDGGRYFFTETQKEVARVHEIDATLLEGLWHQSELRQVATAGLALQVAAGQCHNWASAAAPKLGDPQRRAGFSVDCWLHLTDLAPGQTIADARTDDGRGWALVTTSRGTVGLVISDGQRECSWDTDLGTVTPNRWHHVAAIVDGGPKIISFVVDGQFCDGGRERQFGWGRFDPRLLSFDGGSQVRLMTRLHGDLGGLRVYQRALRTAEAVGNHQAGREP